MKNINKLLTILIIALCLSSGLTVCSTNMEESSASSIHTYYVGDHVDDTYKYTPPSTYTIPNSGDTHAYSVHGASWYNTICGLTVTYSNGAYHIAGTVKSYGSLDLGFIVFSNPQQTAFVSICDFATAIDTGGSLPERVSVTYVCVGPATSQTVSAPVGAYTLIEPYADNPEHTFSGWLCSADSRVYSPGEMIVLSEGTEYTLTGQWTTVADSGDDDSGNSDDDTLSSDGPGINLNTAIILILFVFALIVVIYYCIRSQSK